MPGLHAPIPAPPDLSPSSPPPTTFRRRAWAVLATFLVAYFALQIPSAASRSATYDEPIHLATGYLALTEGDYRLDTTHPPLLRMWAALPLLGRPVKPDTSHFDQWTRQDWNRTAYVWASDFLYAAKDADTWLNRARSMNLVLGALLGVLLFAWLHEWLGFRPAVLGLLFYMIEPNLAAHAALVTTDLGVTCFYFGTAYFLWRSTRAFTLLNLLGLALFTGLAAVSKFSSILLGPAVLLVLIVWVVRGDLPARRAGAIVAWLFAFTVLAIWAVYRFRYAPSPGGGGVVRAGEMAAMARQLPVVGPLLATVDTHHLLPAAYLRGFLLSFTSAEDLPGYLAGQISTDGWWYYFPVAFLLKTPVALLLLAGGGVAALARGRVEWTQLDLACMGLPPAVYLAAAMTTEINLGIRHILPVYPFVLMLAAAAGAAVLRANWRRRMQWLVLGPVVAGGLLVFALSWPHHLTFFNRFVGGADNGAAFLVDSNLDWGQHLKRLKQWMDEQQVGRINLAYFGTVNPDYYGIEDVPLPGSVGFFESGAPQPSLPGYVAVSATLLSGVYLAPEWRLFYRGLAALEPVAVIGNTINVYWVERWPLSLAPRGAPASEIEHHRLLGRRLTEIGWDQQAIIHLRRYLRRYPTDSRVLLRLGQTLVRTGQTEQALPLFQRSVESSPRDGDSRGALATLLLGRKEFADALPHARVYTQLQPGNPYAHDLLGVALACNDRLSEATASFQRALELAPADAAIRAHLRFAREMQDRR